MTIGENNLNELRQGSWSRGSMQRCTPTYSKLKKYTPPLCYGGGGGGGGGINREPLTALNSQQRGL